MDVHTLDDHPGGWHTNRGSWRAILVSHLAISFRDPKRFGPTVWANGLGQRFGPTVWASDSDSMRPPPTTRIQLEAQDRVTGSFSNGRVPYTGLDTTA